MEVADDQNKFAKPTHLKRIIFDQNIPISLKMEIEEDFDALVYPNDAETDFSTISMSPEQNPAPIGNIWSDDEQSSSKIQNPKIMNLLKVIASLLVSPVVTVALSNLGQIYTWGSTPTYVARHGNCRTPGPVPLKSHIK